MNSNDSIGVPTFDPSGFGDRQPFARIGDGKLGGKAAGLLTMQHGIVAPFESDRFPGVDVEVPRSVIIATDVFTAFMDQNRLWEIAAGGTSDSQIAREFQRGDLPEQFIDDLRALVATFRTPLALRSSSLLEETLDRPFAGIYTTKLIANCHPNETARYRRFVNALKLVWASTFFADAAASRKSVGQPADAERTAVIVQEVFGEQRNSRFYPTLTAVARSLNHYPTPGNLPSEGNVTLALGIGKTISDGDHSWSYCPRRPTAPPPFSDTRRLLRYTQNSFWAIDLEAASEHADPLRETECIVRSSLSEAEEDGSLDFLASTYDPASDVMRAGLDGNGPRALTFAPLLHSRTIPFAAVVNHLLEVARDAVGHDVEIELVANLGPDSGLPLRIGLLQIRPMMGASEQFPIEEDELSDKSVVLASSNCLGNGSRTDLSDIVYLKPHVFDRGLTATMAPELDAVNRGLLEEARNAVFIGFGRWGTSDERYGVPVNWAQISAARVIVEISLPGAPAHLSQGTHFFYRVLGFQVLYFSIEHDGTYGVDWDWLDNQPVIWDGRYVRHVRVESPIAIRVDGATRRGFIRTLGG